MSDPHTIYGIVESIVTPMFKYMVPRSGKVLNVNDPKNQGKILVSIPAFGWDTEDKGIWCFPSDKKTMVVPEINEWVIVKWVDAKPELPIYEGIPSFIKDQIVSSYTGNTDEKILFENNTDNVIKYLNGVLTFLIETEINLGDTGGKEVARKDDATLSDSSTDSGFWTFWAAFFGIVTGPPIPEAGGGAPSAFQAALSAAIGVAGGTPTNQTGKINAGSSKVKAVD
jgi:hypothetical protein